MGFFKFLKRLLGLKDEKVLLQLSSFDQVDQLIGQLRVMETKKYQVKKAIGHSMGVYSSSVVMLLDWLDMAIDNIEKSQYVPDKWKMNPERYKTMTLDDYLEYNGYTLYPDDFLKELIEKTTHLSHLMANGSGENDKMSKYYRRQYTPILDDCTVVLKGLYSAMLD